MISLSSKQLRIKIITFILLTIPLYTGCSLFEKENIPKPDLLDHTYEGYLGVQFYSTLPEFDVREEMAVSIDKNGTVLIEPGSLDYYGISIFEEDSKIERDGFWNLTPTGQLVKSGKNISHVNINANITVNDEFKYYTLDKNGKWILYATVPYIIQPYSNLSFNFDDATMDGASFQVSEGQNGAIVWVLALSPVP